MNVHRKRIGPRFLVLLGFRSGLVLLLDLVLVLLDFCLVGLGGMAMLKQDEREVSVSNVL